MNLFYICYEDFSLPGAWTTHVKEVVENLHRLGIKVILFSPAFGELATKLNFKKVYIPIIRIRVLGEYLYYTLLFFYLAFYHRKERVDIIYVREMSCCLTASLISWLFKVPLVIEVNGAILKERKIAGTSKIKIAFFKLLQGLNLASCHRIVVVAEYLKDYLLKNYRVDKRKIRIIENGANTDIFKPMEKKEVRRQLNLAEKCFYLAYVGSFYPHHCVEDIINLIPLLLTKLDNFKILLVGDGLRKNASLLLAKQLKVESWVHYANRVEYNNVPKWINAADVGILFARAGNSQALKMWEYMSCGVPVITNFPTIFKSNKEQIDCGIQVDLQKVDDAAEKIAHLLKNSAARENMEANSRKFIVKKRSWEKTATEIINVCKQVGQ